MSDIELKETEFIVSKDMGLQCSKCTHYKDEHDGPNNHCMHLIATGKLPEAEEFEKAGFKVAGITQRCPCKEFKE